VSEGYMRSTISCRLPTASLGAVSYTKAPQSNETTDLVLDVNLHKPPLSPLTDIAELFDGLAPRQSVWNVKVGCLMARLCVSVCRVPDRLVWVRRWTSKGDVDQVDGFIGR
jgi:hypothetical protein